jgi:pantoate kinase
MIKSKAFAPSHITGFFQIFSNGSTGAGLNTDAGAYTTVTLFQEKKEDLKIFFNDEFADNAEVSLRVVNAYSDYLKDYSLEVRHEILSPIGYGLGMSGAGALSLSIALNNALKLPFSDKECMEVAKFAEIQSGTGLGDVVAQQFSGIMMGLPPFPSEQVKEIPNDGESVICGFFEPIDTGKIIRNSEWKDKINTVGAICMEKLVSDFTLDNFLKLSREFTFETGLASPQLLEVLKEIPESSMAMLGQTVFMLSKNVEKDLQRVSRYTNRVSVSKISTSGAHFIEVE